jgi:hypothetical protein
MEKILQFSLLDCRHFLENITAAWTPTPNQLLAGLCYLAQRTMLSSSSQALESREQLKAGVVASTFASDYLQRMKETQALPSAADPEYIFRPDCAGDLDVLLIPIPVELSPANTSKTRGRLPKNQIHTVSCTIVHPDRPVDPERSLYVC